MTLVGLLNDFLLQKKIGGLSPKTIDSYKNALHVFVLYAGDSLSLKELTQDLVNAYILDRNTRFALILQRSKFRSHRKR